MATDFTHAGHGLAKRSVLHCRCATGHESGACAPDLDGPGFGQPAVLLLMHLMVRCNRALPCALFDAICKLTSNGFVFPRYRPRPIQAVPQSAPEKI